MKLAHAAAAQSIPPLMDTYKHRYRDLKSRFRDYHDLQQKQKSLRWQILLGACVLCLFIRFIAGMIFFYPNEAVIVSVEVPESQAAKSEVISL
jgi:hypothetical protein